MVFKSVKLLNRIKILKIFNEIFFYLYKPRRIPFLATFEFLICLFGNGLIGVICLFSSLAKLKIIEDVISFDDLVFYRN